MREENICVIYYTLTDLMALVRTRHGVTGEGKVTLLLASGENHLDITNDEVMRVEVTCFNRNGVF